MPAELLEIIPGQVLRRKTTPEETASMILFACRSPVANATSLTTFGRKCLSLDGNQKLVSNAFYSPFGLNLTANRMQSEFNVTTGKDLLTVRGRELPTPNIVYLDLKNKTSHVRTTEGSWNMRDVKVVTPGRPINKWAFLHLEFTDARKPDHDSVVNAMKQWVSFMQRMGIKIVDGPCIPSAGALIGIQRAVPMTVLKEKFKALQQLNAQLVFVVLPGKKTDTTVYNAVKYLGDVEFGIHTVCVLRDQITKCSPQYFANVALKVNLKMGGANHKLSNDIKIIKEGKTMVLGYDVTHPTNLAGGAEGLPSLVGMVSSIDQDLSQYPAAAWAQAGKQEMLDKNLKEVFASRIKLWSRHNKSQTPQNIIIFRDGVSEGQFDQVLEKELPFIRDACATTCPANQQPKITIVVSVKRHQTRFYPTDSQHITRSRNIKNGTVVDRGVTQAKVWDFFLTAHQALQGNFPHICGSAIISY